MYSRYSKGNIFNDVKVEAFPRHVFNKSYTNSFTCNHGYAIPFFVDDVQPGDKIDLNTYGRVQLQPLATASMQNIRCYMRYFYVPYRLVWDKWDEFISQDGFIQNPMLAPYTVLSGDSLNQLTKPGGLLDFLGINLTNYTTSIEDGELVPHYGSYTRETEVAFTLFRHFAYWLIWDTYYRDENLQSKVLDSIAELVPGYNLVLPNTLNTLLPVSYEKDYFTTALPWPQKGEPVNLNAYLVQMMEKPYTLNYGAEHRNMSLGYIGNSEDPSQGQSIWADIDGNLPAISTPNTNIDPRGFATSININDLRYSNALQRYLERLALGGNRPAEFYLSMFGVRIDDLRIGQPLYLGGGYDYVHVTPVTQQSETAQTPQGTLAGNGTANPSFGINAPYYCTEPGIFMGIFSLRPEINYTQGLCKQLKRFSHLDYYNPIFAHLGEEPVMKSELMVYSGFNNNPARPSFDSGESSLYYQRDEIFGYQSRFADLKDKRNEVHGELKSTLNTWLLSKNFVNPRLNSDFITVDQNYDIFAVIEETLADHYICEFHHEYMVESSMPDFVIPSL